MISVCGRGRRGGGEILAGVYRLACIFESVHSREDNLHSGERIQRDPIEAGKSGEACDVTTAPGQSSLSIPIRVNAFPRALILPPGSRVSI